MNGNKLNVCGALAREMEWCAFAWREIADGNSDDSIFFYRKKENNVFFLAAEFDSYFSSCKMCDFKPAEKLKRFKFCETYKDQPKMFLDGFFCDEIIFRYLNNS